jgi:hypothetical protein
MLASSRHRLTTSIGCVLALLVALAGMVMGGSPAHAAGSEQITDYRVALTAEADGDLRVSESIDYDFGTADRHGIQRGIPTSKSWPAKPDYNRVWEIDDLHATQDGDKAKVVTDDSDGVTVIRVGDKDKTVTGVHHYVLDYSVRGAFLNQHGRTELAWNALGTTTEVPVQRADVRLTAPPGVDATPLGCVYGDAGTNGQSCQPTGNGYAVTGLEPGQGVTVGYGFPAGSIANVGPILKHKITFGWALTGQRWSTIVGIAVFVLGTLGVLLLWWRRGRDLVFAGQIPGLTPAPGQSQTTTTAGAVETAVSFTPPPDVRPAELGFVMREGFDQRDVTATIVDLAVRGYLRIEEVREPGADAAAEPSDHRIVSLRGFARSSAAGDAQHYRGAAGDQLNDYELAILRGLFGRKTEILLSKKKHKLADTSARVSERVTRYAVERSWFRGDPSAVRKSWLALGAVLTVAGLLGTVMTVHFGIGLLGVGIAALGIAVLIVGPKMPRKLPAGSAVNLAGHAFRRYIATAEAEQLRAEERQEIFNRYLPYAIVFDLADHWVKTFADTMVYADAGRGVAPGPYYAGWYVGGYGFDGLGDFDRSLASFGEGVSATLVAQSSGGSSFGGGSFSSVGGGGGGGGVGSW